MRKFKVKIRAIDVEKMWDFAQTNHISIHYKRNIREDSTDIFNNTIYTYELLMAPETYTVFALSVPVIL